eukprot:9983964-Ditylum_brightwellii.AAC.1
MQKRKKTQQQHLVVLSNLPVYIVLPFQAQDLAHHLVQIMLTAHHPKDVVQEIEQYNCYYLQGKMQKEMQMHKA